MLESPKLRASLPACLFAVNELALAGDGILRDISSEFPSTPPQYVWLVLLREPGTPGLMSSHAAIELKAASAVAIQMTVR
jgi:hypothetical protein